MNDEGIVINYFRVIPVKNKKVKESYPFPNSTFNELYQWDGYPDDDRYKKFSDSKFLEELRKTYPVFIVFWEYKATSEINGNLEEKKELVSGLEIIEDFSFMTFKKEAQKVYEETVEAFCMGKESLFPKISDDLKFHVRPKAVNAEDTFEFSNGDLLTKRTFWANSKTIEELINEKREDIVFQR
nr:hypothetical protein A5866_002129 [Enterococcus sp. 12C11_DIV0727]